MKLSDCTYDASVYFHSSTVRLRDMIADAAEREAEHIPGNFRGTCACIFYRSAYAYPYDSFDGLRRYILAIKDKTGLRSRFKGYVAIDFSEWAEHVDEQYFQVFLMYLADHADGIHYLLFFGERETDTQVKVLRALLKYMTVRIEEPAKFGNSRELKNAAKEA